MQPFILYLLQPREYGIWGLEFFHPGKCSRGMAWGGSWAGPCLWAFCSNIAPNGVAWGDTVDQWEGEDDTPYIEGRTGPLSHKPQGQRGDKARGLEHPPNASLLFFHCSTVTTQGKRILSGILFPCLATTTVMWVSAKDATPPLGLR